MPEWSWIDAHYYVNNRKDASGQWWMICRRCNTPVGYLTKHAALRHGDIIPIEPATNDNPATELLW